jgi:hypothetical protein
MSPISAEDFLAKQPSRKTTLQGAATVNARLFLGKGQLATEIVVYETPSSPTNSTLRSLWKARNNGRPTPVIVVALHGLDLASICGAIGEEPPVECDLDRGQIERLCEEVLSCADRNQALNLFGRTVDSLRASLPGIRNEGLFSKHELANRTSQRPDWSEASAKGLRALGRKGTDLLRELGYTISRCDNHTAFLHGGNKKLALVVVLEENEPPDAGSLRFAGLSPVSYALAKADEERLPYVITVAGGLIRLYPTALSAGIGRRGRTETFVEASAAIMPDNKAALMWLLFSADALQPEGSLQEILEESTRYAGTLAENLRERIYGKVVPNLAQVVVAARRLKNPKAQDLKETYEIALTILFRLLFIAYAEDKDLLPFRHNGLYQKRSLKTKAIELLEGIRKETPYDEGAVIWTEIQSLFTAIDQGNRTWGVPHYNGGLFSSDPEVSLAGPIIQNLKLSDDVFGPILADLVLIEQDGALGPVDFASLGVREFGTVYEGLLESELSVAETDLTLDADQAYVPAGAKSKIAVKKGAVYLHNSSGARKATGSYFTKDFAVQYLIDRSLAPALKKHLAKLDTLSDDDTVQQFFDFKVADISMGSGHFLTAAIDRIEADLSGYLAKRPLKGVRTELDALRTAARDALGEIADQLDPIEDNKLLRRIIARRCIYGVDINPLSVQLARLAVWIHTFVPGLPLSLLDRNLACGNSLIGIGTVDEIQKRFENANLALFEVDAKALLATATEPLKRLAQISDATFSDIERARRAIREAEKAVEPADALCTIITALPLTKIRPDATKVEKGMSKADKTARGMKLIAWEKANQPLENFQFEEWEKNKSKIVASAAHKRGEELLAETNALHFPIAFPEVFLRERSGFDCVLGNPPWQEITIEEKGFWTRYFPGLKGVSQREYEGRAESFRKNRPDLLQLFEKESKEANTLRKILATGAHSMGAGDPDLYKAFVWRFWDLTRIKSGEIGVVLPRSALSAKGSEEFRQEILKAEAGMDCCFLINGANWVFDGVDPRYTVSLTNFSKAPEKSERILLRGPFANKKDFDKGSEIEPQPVTSKQVLQWNESASLPLLPSAESLGVFLQLRKAPRIDSEISGGWIFRPATDFHATNDKSLMDLESEKCPKGYWPVFKGESFDVWVPDTGTYYAWADPEPALHELQRKRSNTFKRDNSPFFGISAKEAMDIKTLPPKRARIAFRDVARATDTRTFRTSLIPPGCFLTNKGPYWVRVRGTEIDEAFLLGVTSSIPFDWYARRFVELNANFFLINPMPVPRPESGNILRKRIVELAGRLACPDARFKDWADAVGVDYGALDPKVKEDMIHELDAVAAHLYRLDKKQLTHIFETFHVGWDYTPRLKATLVHFDRWKT